MASTAEELSSQSEQLQEMVAFFKVKGAAQQQGFSVRSTASSRVSSVRLTQLADDSDVVY